MLVLQFNSKHCVWKFFYNFTLKFQKIFFRHSTSQRGERSAPGQGPIRMRGCEFYNYPAQQASHFLNQ